MCRLSDLFLLTTQVTEVSAWLEGQGGAKLADYLAADHTTLEANEASQDKKGGGMMAAAARMMNMTHDEIILKVGHV